MGNYYQNSGIARYWWMPAITGLLAIAIGVWCFLSPVTSLPSLAYAFAIIITAAGICNLCYAVFNTHMQGWGWSLAYAIIELITGIWMLCLPLGVMTTVFIYAVAIYLIVVAINAICEICSIYSTDSTWFGWLLALLLITLLFAIIFISGPIGGGIAAWLWIGISFLAFGFYRIMVSARLHRFNKSKL